MEPGGRKRGNTERSICTALNWVELDVAHIRNTLYRFTTNTFSAAGILGVSHYMHLTRSRSRSRNKLTHLVRLTLFAWSLSTHRCSADLLPTRSHRMASVPAPLPCSPMPSRRTRSPRDIPGHRSRNPCLVRPQSRRYCPLWGPPALRCSAPPLLLTKALDAYQDARCS